MKWVGVLNHIDIAEVKRRHLMENKQWKKLNKESTFSAIKVCKYFSKSYTLKWFWKAYNWAVQANDNGILFLMT